MHYMPQSETCMMNAKAIDMHSTPTLAAKA
jgi:hypothetical protein